MQKAQKTYTAEFKREAVRLAQASGKPITQVARELGISDTSIQKFRKELAEHGSEAFPGSSHQTALEEENRRRDPGTGEDAAGTRYSKKNSGYLHTRPIMRYQFIEEHRGEYPVNVLCQTGGGSLSADTTRGGNVQ